MEFAKKYLKVIIVTLVLTVITLGLYLVYKYIKHKLKG